MALVTTFATTPLTAALYPPSYQKKLEAWKKGLIDWDTGRSLSNADTEDNHSVMFSKLESAKVKSLLVYLRLDNMPTLLTFVSLLGGRSNDALATVHPARKDKKTDSVTSPYKKPVDVHGVRILELTERDSSVMKVTEIEEYSNRDPIINTFRNFGRLNNLCISGEIAVAPEASFAEVLTAKASREESDLLLLPWSESGSMSEWQTSSGAMQARRDSTSYSAFVAEALKLAACNTAVLVNRGFGGSVEGSPLTLTRKPSAISIHNPREKVSTPVLDRSHHIFMPYFGGTDGRVALRLVLQLAENPDITATIIHFENPDLSAEHDMYSSPATSHGDAMEAQASTQNVKAFHTVHTTAEARDSHASFFAAIQKSLPAGLTSRVILDTVQTTTPLSDAVARAQNEVSQNPKNAGDLIVLGRNAGFLAEETTGGGCLGAVADQFLDAGLAASVLVLQARGRNID